MMRRVGRFLAVAVGLLALTVAGLALYLTQRYVHPPYRQAFINGRVLTMDASNTVAEGVVIERERILAVGSASALKPYIDAQTTVIDLGGKTLMPGIIDAHGHFPGTGVGELAVDLNSPPIGEVRSLDEAYARLRAHAAKTPQGKWILAYGFDDSVVAERRFPHRLELDAISTTHPIYVLHISGHGGVANSLALSTVGYQRDMADPSDGVIGRDPGSRELSGLVFETPSNVLRDLATHYSVVESLGILQRASEQYLAMGVSTAQNGVLTAANAKTMVPMARANLLPLRLNVWPDKAVADSILDGTLIASDTPRLHWGAFKLTIDGSLQACTGFLTKPYLRCPEKGSRGHLTMSLEEFRERVFRYHAAGRQIAVHTNGDAATDALVETFRAAQAQNKRDDPRAIIVHAQTIRSDQLDAAKDLGMTPSFFSGHVYYWGDRHRDIYLGPDRAERISPAATALAKGVPFTLHLDSPVVPMNPWLLAWSAVKRETSSGKLLGPQERISPMQALRGMTIDAAWQSFLERDLGSIEPGKLADVIVLTADPLDGDALRTMTVEQTVVGGVTVFRR